MELELTLKKNLGPGFSEEMSSNSEIYKTQCRSRKIMVNCLEPSWYEISEHLGLHNCFQFSETHKHLISLFDGSPLWSLAGELKRTSCTQCFLFFPLVKVVLWIGNFHPVQDSKGIRGLQGNVPPNASQTPRSPFQRQACFKQLGHFCREIFYSCASGSIMFTLFCTLLFSCT